MNIDSRNKLIFKSGDRVRTIKNDGTPTGGIVFTITTVLIIEKNPNPKDKIWWKSPNQDWYRQSNLIKAY